MDGSTNIPMFFDSSTPFRLSYVLYVSFGTSSIDYDMKVLILLMVKYG
jgi:hypothetical protein